MCYNGVFTDFNNSIQFSKFDDKLIQINGKMFSQNCPFKFSVRKNMVITIEELYENKQLYIAYMLSLLMTVRQGKIFQFSESQMRIFGVPPYRINNYFIRGYRSIIKNKLGIPSYALYGSNPVSASLIPNQQTFIYMWDNNPQYWDPEIVESSELNKLKCKKFIKNILKGHLNSDKKIMNLLNGILERLIENFEDELNSIEEFYSEIDLTMEKFKTLTELFSADIAKIILRM